MSTSRRWTFTLRDMFALTIAVAVALIWIAAWIPLARVGGHRRQCLNSQQQVGKAVQTRTVTANDRFPGYQNDHNGTRFPWTVSILTELGRGDLYDVFASTQAVPVTRIDILLCPQDPTKFGPDIGPNLSYVINSGCASDNGDKPANGVALDRFHGAEPNTLSYVAEHDGASQTLMLSENLQATRWDKPGRLETTFLWHDTTTPSPIHRINGGSRALPLSPLTARPSSNHNGGVVVTFCDGHAGIISEKISYKVYMQLMTPNGAESDMPATWKGFALRESDFDSW